MLDQKLRIKSQNVRRRPVRKVVFKIVALLSWLALLFVTIRFGGEVTESRKEIEDLSGRLKNAEEEAATNKGPSAADLANAKAEASALKKALQTLNGKMEQLQKQSAHEREQVLQESAQERETLTTAMAKALSRTGLSQEELETLLADLPADDRRRLLEKVTELKATAPAGVDQPPTTEVATSPDVSPAPKAIMVPEAKPEVAPTAEKPKKKVDPKPITYTVKSGDNLTRIARKFDVSPTQIMKHNGIPNANLLRIGQVLKIPQN